MTKISELAKKVIEKCNLSILERELAHKVNRSSYISTIMNTAILVELLEEMREIKVLLGENKLDINLDIAKVEITDEIVEDEFEEAEEVVEEETEQPVTEEVEDEIEVPEEKVEEKPEKKEEKHELSASTKRRIKAQRKKKK